MNQEQGCQFCRRYGLPLLPVRPGLRERDDSAPELTSAITHPLITAQGETAYTARLLREGFLYIWNEMARSWINYFVTDDGFYYPLPESGEVPPSVAEGKSKPCITAPAELARASLITLPVMPPPFRNGRFWFAWSEVEWTDAVRQRHEDAAWREQYMQPFDMAAWLDSGQAENVLPVSDLMKTVAEYSTGGTRSPIRQWSPAHWKKAKPMDAGNLLAAAEALSPGKGGIIVLTDPVALVREISSLVTWRLETRFASDPHYSRGIALSSALSGLKQVMMQQFRLDLQAEDNASVQMSRAIGNRIIAGVPLPPDDPQLAAATTRRSNEATFDARLEQRAKERWADYEKYIDRDKENAFLEALGKAVKTCNEEMITPMTQMYLAWLKSTALRQNFLQHYDSNNIQSGLCYLQSVTDCLLGMQDQAAVSEWLHDQLVAEAFSGENYILRALVFNNDAVAKLLQEKAAKASDVNDVPWDKLVDGIKSATEDYSKMFSLKMEYYINAISSGFVRLLQGAAWSKPALALVAMVASSGYGLKVVAITTTRKHFIEAALKEIARMTGIRGGPSLDSLRHYFDKALRSMKLDGIPLDERQERHFMVLIDKQETVRMAALPRAERSKEVGTILRSADDVTDAIFPRFYRSKLALLRGSTATHLAGLTAGAVPFWGCMASVIFQGVALKSAAGDRDLLSWEKGSRFVANAVGAFGSTLELTERALNDLRTLRLSARVRIKMGNEFLKRVRTILKITIRICSFSAVVGIAWDWINSFDYMAQGNYGMMTASFISAAGGVMLAGAIFGMALGPLGIAWGLIFIFGSAIYMAIKGDNDLQKWLKSCLWRKVPDSLYSPPEIYPDGDKEMAAFNQIITAGDH